MRATPLVRKVAQELGVDLATRDGHRPAGADHGGGRPRGLVRTRPGAGTETVRRDARPAARRQAADVRAPDARAPRDPGRDLGRGVRLLGRRPEAARSRSSSRRSPSRSREFPELNARVEDGELVLLDRYDIGIAVQTEQGLVVPVVHGADKRSLDELDAEVRRLAEAAHAGNARSRRSCAAARSPSRARARRRACSSTPLINHPEVAILGIHRIEERPVVRDGEVVVRRMGNVSVTFDHRVIDGKRAADFGLAVIARLRELGRPRLGEVRLEHRLDPRRGRAAFEPRRRRACSTTSASAGTWSTRKRSARSGRSSTSTLLTRSAVALLARDVGEQALHPPGGTGALRGEEDEAGDGRGSRGPPCGICANNGRNARRGYGCPHGRVVLDRRERRARRGGRRPPRRASAARTRSENRRRRACRRRGCRHRLRDRELAVGRLGRPRRRNRRRRSPARSARRRS